ncbi:uncharacterized protein LOC121201756 isoform X1 [Betta splendens]|uniref:Uncharacterized protein LOC121201756 isoform X1 n=1 Tax=Betta splendens TaxID=158456 RepID=A0A8M1H657_BETSP|nr:uncharacterized protein LOC121201756 isoform X1 [Betta splendens]XP_055369889.1 uncharacterized protein LOC121201756 isoform X1 [Betta splendens]
MSSNSSLSHLFSSCFESRLTNLIFTSQLITSLLLYLPLWLFIIYVGAQRRRRQRSSAAAAVMSHSDCLTYNMAATDTLSILASGCYCSAVSSRLQWAGFSIFALTVPGQTLFHLLTCVERYLAVVHPVAYLALKQAGGVRIRNVSSGCVWLLCCSMTGWIQVILTSLYFGLMFFFLVVICFCTFSILRVLKHPGPGRSRRSKQRAFHTVVAVLVALTSRLVAVLVALTSRLVAVLVALTSRLVAVLVALTSRLVAVLVCSVMFSLSLTDAGCAVGSSAMWLSAPGSLVLPVLFLQRAGKLPGGRKAMSPTRER